VRSKSSQKFPQRFAPQIEKFLPICKRQNALKGSVLRKNIWNPCLFAKMCKEICSLLLSRPSRGAWIEILS